MLQGWKGDTGSKDDHGDRSTYGDQGDQVDRGPQGLRELATSSPMAHILAQRSSASTPVDDELDPDVGWG